MLRGWTPTRHVRYVFDADGKVVGETITEEPEWDMVQREMMLALAEAEADQCPGCGGWLSFTTRKDHGHRVTSVQCQQCVAIEIYQEQRAKEDEATKGSPLEERASARRVSVQPIPLPENEPEQE